MKIRQVEAELLRAELKKLSTTNFHDNPSSRSRGVACGVQKYTNKIFIKIRQVEAELLSAVFKEILKYQFS